jgi:hypothetical protein
LSTPIPPSRVSNELKKILPREEGIFLSKLKKLLVNVKNVLPISKNLLMRRKLLLLILSLKINGLLNKLQVIAKIKQYQ